MPKKRKSLSKFLKEYYNLINQSDEVEIWKDIELGDKVLYQVSNHGQIRRKENGLIINPFHSYRKDKDGNFILDRPTYLRVQLYYYENGKRKKKHFEISRLVAKYFIPIPQKYIDEGYTEDTLQVNHIKGGYEIYNNFVSNLEWCTSQENVDKAFETGLRHPPKGENHHSTFIDINSVMKICKCIEKGMNAKNTYIKMCKYKRLKTDISKIEYTIFKSLFYSIKYKKSWVYVSQNYNF